MGATECKGCITSDPTSDTVKVNPTLLADADGKAAADMLEKVKEQQLQREAEEQKARESVAEEERQQREAEERRGLEVEAEEQARLERLERERVEECERLAREEQENAAPEREAQERAAAEEAARRAQLEEQRVRQAEEARLAAELEDAKKKVNTFLKARGFGKGIAAPKTSCMKSTYPLHVAVEENSAEMVRALLKCGADKAAKNSAGLTPHALAQKLDKKKHVHSAVLTALA